MIHNRGPPFVFLRSTGTLRRVSYTRSLKQNVMQCFTMKCCRPTRQEGSFGGRTIHDPPSGLHFATFNVLKFPWFQNKSTIHRDLHVNDRARYSVSGALCLRTQSVCCQDTQCVVNRADNGYTAGLQGDIRRLDNAFHGAHSRPMLQISYFLKVVEFSVNIVKVLHVYVTDTCNSYYKYSLSLKLSEIRSKAY